MKDNEQFEIPESLFSPPATTDVVATEPAPDGITTTATPWHPRLAFDIALGIDGVDVILTRYELDEEQLQYLLLNPLFMRGVARHRQDIQDNGIGFKAKARLQAETYLAELDQIISDRSVGPSVRLAAIQSVVKYAGLEPTKGDGGGGQTTKLIIQWGDGSNQMAVEMKNGGAAEGEGND